MAELIAGSTAGGYELLHRGNINGLTLNNLTLTGTITIDSGATLGVLSPTELGYLDGVTSNIQTQLNAKLPLAGGTITGNIVVGGTTRNLSVIGTYDSTKTQQIWSMGTPYLSSADGSNFGSLYGLAYKHTNNTTGGTMAGNHQMVWCQNGNPTAALGDGIWTSGNVYEGGTALSSKYLGISANAASATVLSTTRTTYKGVTDACVVGELMWKHYGNSHTIFDASNGTAPNGAAIDRTNPTYGWSATHPTLMGWNGAATYGVRVESSRITDNIPTSDIGGNIWIA